MSRLGKIAIKIPEEVNLKIEKNKVVITGPKGELELVIPHQIKIQASQQKVLVSRKGDNNKAKALHGTIRQTLANMIKGVSQGWSKTLEIVGTGYRAALEGENLVLHLGFSHPVEVKPPVGIKLEVSEGKVKVLGQDKVLVGQIASKIRKIKPPDVYKGKGIRYQGEEIRLKPGKAAKVGSGLVGGKG